MDNEKEPLLADMKPSQEDIALRQKQLQARKAAAARAAAGRPQAAAPAVPAVSAAKPSQTLAVMSLVLALALAAVAGWLFMQVQSQQQQLSNAEKLLRSQAQNIEVLNEKLSVTGENANLSVDALKAIVKEHDSEIRKLWDVANKRNRADISSNSKAIDGLKSGLAKTDKDIRTELDKQQKQIAATDSASQNRAAELTKRLGKVETQLPGIAAAELRLAQQAETIQALESEIARMKKSGIGTDAADIRLQLEDINIRLDRMQAAIGTR